MSVDDYLEFRLLKYILAVADAGTFTAAASKLFTSQSSLSAQIKQLEALCANMSETSIPSTITVGRGKKSHLDKHEQNRFFFRCVGSFGA
jgi:hypothetical protein